MMDIFKQINQYAGIFFIFFFILIFIFSPFLSAVPFSFHSNEKIKSCLSCIPLYDEGALYKHSVEV